MGGVEYMREGGRERNKAWYDLVWYYHSEVTGTLHDTRRRGDKNKRGINENMLLYTVTNEI